jgi:FMN phosphatase YigB (HAD superfamily)
VRDVLAGTGLAARWDGVVTAADAGYPKPDPRLFHHALAQARASPADVVMVGDSYERDVLGARAAGIHRAVLVDRHRARTVDDVPVITSLDALPAALARLAPSLN